MAAPTAPAETMQLDRSDGSATLALYRAALGPLRRDYYLRAFTRFDAEGKTGPAWNGEAAFFTLNWLALRKLWAAAFVYVGALLFAALLLIGIGRVVLQLDATTQWALAALVALAAFAVPGLWGTAWLYKALSKPMEHALVETATLEEACAVLAAQAPGRKRLGLVVGVNLALGAAVAATVVAWPDAATLPLHSSAMEAARDTPSVPQASGLVRASQTAAPAPAPLAAASTQLAAVPAPQASPSRVSTGVVGVAPALSVAQAPVPKTLASAPVAEASAPVARAAPAKNQTPAPVAPPTRAPAPQAKASAADRPPADSRSYLINVGLFADENNARNASTKLRDAGLPVQVQTLQSAKGKRTRVRVGPYDTQVEADRAAEQIRALRLEAVVLGP